MATLRIAIESGDAVRGANAAREALRALGAQAIQAERQVLVSSEEMERALGDLAEAPTPSFEKLIAESRQRLQDHATAVRNEGFDRSLEAPLVQHFGGNLAGTGLFSQAELGGTVAELRIAREEAARAQAALAGLRDSVTQIGSDAPGAFEASADGAARLAEEAGGASGAVRELVALRPDAEGIQAAQAEVARLGASLEEVGAVGPDAFGRAAVGAQDLDAATRGAVRAQEELVALEARTGVVRATPNLASPVSLGGATSVDNRGAELIAAQERAYAGARTAAAEYGATVERSVGGANAALDVNLRTLLRVGGAIIGVRSVAAGIDSLVTYEQSLVQVSQATGLYGASLQDLNDRILEVSASGLPVLTRDLLSFAESAGRLQIRTPEGVEKFVRDVALLRTIAPDLGGGPEQAGDAIGRFLKLSGESPNNVGRLADVIARLDDEFGAAGTTIFETGEQIAKASQEAIRSSADVLGLGAAFASLGVEGGQGGQAIAQVMTVVRDAVQRGGQEIRSLAQITGLSAEQIRQSFRTDAASLFVSVLEGLARQGDESAQAMDDLGLASARQAVSLGPLIANTDELRRGLQLARDAQINGGDAAAEAAKVQDTLAAKLTTTRNLFTGLAGESGVLVGGLKGIVDVGNEVASDLFRVEGSARNVGDAAHAAADGLRAAAVAGASALIVQRLSAAYRVLSAEIVTTKAALDLATLSTVTTTTATTGLAAAWTRAGVAVAGFITSPLGIAVAAGAAVAGIVALSRALDDLDGERAAKELDKVRERMSGLDRAADGLRDARDIIFKANLTGDADARIQGLRARLRELEGAATVIAGEIRLSIDKGSSPIIGGDVESQFREVFQGFSKSGFVIQGSELAQRMNAAIAAAVADVQVPQLPPEKVRGLKASIDDAFDGLGDGSAERIQKVLSEAFQGAPPKRAKELQDAVDDLIGSLDPARAEAFRASLDSALGGVSVERLATIKQSLAEAFSGIPPETADRLRASVVQAVSAASIPAGKLEALKVDELFPDVEGAGLNFRSAIEDAIGGAREAIESERVALQAKLSEALRINPGQFAGASLQTQIADLASVDSFAERLGPKLQEQVTELFGPELGQRAKNALLASLSGAVEGIDPEALKIDLGALSTGEIDSAGIDRLAAALEQAGASGIGAVDALRAVDEAIEQTRAQIDAAGAKNPSVRPSDFYVDEAKRIREAIQDAELSIGRLSPRESVQQSGDTTVVRTQREDLTGLDARREALVRERAEYEETLKARLRATETSQRISDAEAHALGEQADRLLQARDAALLFGEAQRRLGAEQQLLTARSNILGQQIQLLGLNAQGETSHAFELLREQIELTRAAAEKDIEIRIAAGDTPDDEIERLRRVADAQRKVSLATLEQQKYLAENRREIDLLAQSSDSFGNNAFDALVGLQDPLEALKSLLLDVGRSIVVPQLKAGFLDVITGKDDRLRNAAAQQAGVRDLLPEGPPPESLPSLDLPPRAAPVPIDELAAQASQLQELGVQAVSAGSGLEGVGSAAPGASAGLDAVGTAAQAAGSAADHLATAAELAARALEHLAGRESVQSVPLTAPIPAPTGADAATALPFQVGVSGGAAGADAGAEAFGQAAGVAAGDALGSTVQPLLGGIAGAPGQRASAPLEALGADLELPDRSPAQVATIAQAVRPGPLGRQEPATALPGLPLAVPSVGARGTAALGGLDLGERVGLDALDDGALDAARAIKAASPEVDTLAAAVQPAAGALAGVPRVVTSATGALGELAPAAEAAVKPIQVIGSSTLEDLPRAQSVLASGAVDAERDAAARSIGGAIPPATGDLDFSALQDAASAAALHMESVSLAGQSASAGMTIAGASSQVTAAGMTLAGGSSEVAALGMTAAQQAAVSVVASFFAASRAAAVYAAQAGARAAVSALPGGAPIGSFAKGGVPGVADLDGQIISSPTYALIGEGADREAVMPLDAGGRVRGVSSRGERVPLELTRDGSGKLGVRVPEQDEGVREQRFALGGVPVIDRSSSSHRIEREHEMERSTVERFELGGVPIIHGALEAPVELFALGGVPGTRIERLDRSERVRDVERFALGGVPAIGRDYEVDRDAKREHIVQRLALGGIPGRLERIEHSSEASHEVERLALGGIPGRETIERERTALERIERSERIAAEARNPVTAGATSARGIVQLEKSIAAAAPDVISTSTQQSTSSLHFVSHYHFHGNTTPDAGFRRSARHHEQDLRDRTRNVLKGRVR